jgi:hypothetical protein
MNAHATTAIRELTAQELDQVTGGAPLTHGMSVGEVFFAGGIIGSVVAGAITCLFDWLFG